MMSLTTTSNVDIDAMYEAFCARLPAELREVARALQLVLRLAPDASVPWSETFKHEVTLRAPAMLVEAMPGVDPLLVESATTAHMLSVLEAFGTDRIRDGQVPDQRDLRNLLHHMRRHATEHLKRIGGTPAAALCASAGKRTIHAIESERSLLIRGGPATMTIYESISGGKQAVGLPASLVLARALGWDQARADLVSDLLMGVWLGLQFVDDVADWEDDVRHGGAWAEVLAKNARHPRTQESLDDIRQLVHRSGVLTQMLEAAARKFRTAREIAAEIGARALASWAAEQELAAIGYRDGETRSPGFVGRSRALAPWLAEVIR